MLRCIDNIVVFCYNNIDISKKKLPHKQMHQKEPTAISSDPIDQPTIDWQVYPSQATTWENFPEESSLSQDMKAWNGIREEIGSAIEAPSDADIRVTILAVTFHELWLRTRRVAPDGALYADGRLVPRIKPTTDEEWIEQHDGVDSVDIASEFMPDLPSDWKAENLAAAEVIDTLIQDSGGGDHIDLSDEAVRHACGATIHDAWLTRNEYAKGGPLDVPFSELPADEQAKDLVQLEFALQILAKDTSDTSQPWMTRLWQAMNNWALDRNLLMRALNGDWISPDSPYYCDQADLRRAGLR